MVHAGHVDSRNDDDADHALRHILDRLPGGVLHVDRAGDRQIHRPEPARLHGIQRQAIGLFVLGADHGHVETVAVLHAVGDRIACGLRISHRGIVRRAAGQHGDAEDGCKETGCGTPRETGHRVAFLNSTTVSTWWVVG